MADWQSIVALAIVAGALAFIVRRVIRKFTAEWNGGCETSSGCAGCPKSRESASITTIVPLADRNDPPA